MEATQMSAWEKVGKPNVAYAYTEHHLSLKGKVLKILMNLKNSVLNELQEPVTER